MEKSSAPARFIAYRSRACIGANPHRHSIMRRIEQCSYGPARSTRAVANGPIATQFNVRGWPTLYVVDHKGVIRHKWVGSPGAETMDKALEKLVKEAEEDTKKDPK